MGVLPSRMWRQYNQSYNFFAGMSDDASRNIRRIPSRHRPTWKMGMTASALAENRGRTASSEPPIHRYVQ